MYKYSELPCTPTLLPGKARIKNDHLNPKTGTGVGHGAFSSFSTPQYYHIGVEIKWLYGWKIKLMKVFRIRDALMAQQKALLKQWSLLPNVPWELN